MIARDRSLLGSHSRSARSRAAATTAWFACYIYIPAVTHGSWLEPLPHRVAASPTQGCSLPHIRLQPPSPTIAASITHGCSLHRLRLQPLSQPPSPTVAAAVAHGCSLHHLRLQPPSNTVTGSAERTDRGGAPRNQGLERVRVSARDPRDCEPQCGGVSCCEPQLSWTWPDPGSHAMCINEHDHHTR